MTGVDYNRDGRVGMNEAYSYALINDQTIAEGDYVDSDRRIRVGSIQSDQIIFEFAYMYQRFFECLAKRNRIFRFQALNKRLQQMSTLRTYFIWT